jgi:hypothetical protein
MKKEEGTSILFGSFLKNIMPTKLSNYVTMYVCILLQLVPLFGVGMEHA